MSSTEEAIAQTRKAVEPDKPKHVLRTLGKSIREYKKASLLAPALVAVEGILEILIPTIMASLIDEGITGGSMPSTIKFGVILLICAMVSLGAGFLSGKFAAIAGAGFAKNLRQDQFKKVQGFSFTNIDRFSTGSIVTRLTTDVTNLQNAYMSFNSPLMMVCVYASMILIAWMGAQQIVASGNNAAVGLTTGDLTALVTYAMQILMAMMMLSMIFTMVIISQASAERICQVLQEESTVTDPANPVTDMADGAIEFDHVTFRYSDSSEKPVLDDINLKIRSGMTIGIVGGTGSAKSSLVQLVPRLYDVSSGSLKVGGVDVRDYDLEALRDQVAMVLQKNVLFSGTIAENLRWGNPNATDEEVRHAAQLAQADGFVQEFPDKYDTYIEQGGANVSGGQRQRLCIARALLKKPKILILDDSTSAVDTKTDKLIRNAFHNEIPDTTKIIIAQRVASVEESDMILVMDNGRIMASGTHDELLATCDEYRSIYESQTKNQARPEELVAAEPAGAQSETETKEGETR